MGILADSFFNLSIQLLRICFLRQKSCGNSDGLNLDLLEGGMEADIMCVCAYIYTVFPHFFLHLIISCPQVNCYQATFFCEISRAFRPSN